MTKLNPIAPLACAVLVVTAVSIEPAAAVIEPLRGLHLIEPAAAFAVPAPIIGAGLPALGLLAAGYRLVRKLRRRRSTGTRQ